MSVGGRDGRVVVVFGGGTVDGGPPGVPGIGRATAALFARRGDTVAVVDRDRAAADRTVGAIRRDGGDALAVAADVTDPLQVDSAVAAVMAAHGRIDIVDYNVGTALLGGPLDITLDQWRSAQAVNLVLQRQLLSPVGVRHGGGSGMRGLGVGVGVASSTST